MKGHLWYLTQELLPLALFSNLEEQQKHTIVEVLNQHQNNRRGTGLGKPCFPTLPTEVTVDLAKFAVQDSYLYFHILRLDTAFLHIPVAKWVQKHC